MLYESAAFVLAATALLGSPGPGITALVAVGRSFPRSSAMRFYAAMQVGLAIAAAVSTLGVAALIEGAPVIHTLLLAVGSLYLFWLAWTMAAAPVGTAAIREGEVVTAGLKGAFLLGVANPKAYLAFASLIGSFTLLPDADGRLDAALKWALCVVVMIVVDFAWLVLGMMFGRVSLSARAERLLNIVMGGSIVLACLTTWS